MKKQQFSDYYLGFDIGTNSVGWCVTDLNYNVLRFNKKDMWGSRLFDEAKTAAERRVQRNSRRRLKRRKWRLNLLEEIFSNEILRVDSNFFRRLKESSLWLEDKSSKEKFTLFNDDNYKDYDFYKQYPTIFHLRNELIKNPEKKDIRLVYLALHSIFKSRGHFLFEGQNLKDIKNFETLYNNLMAFLEDNDIYKNIDSSYIGNLENIICDSKKGLKDKEKEFKEIFNSDKQLVAFFKLSVGSSVSLNDLFDTDEYKKGEVEKEKIELHPKSWTQDWRCSFFVSKLTREDKIEKDIVITFNGIYGYEKQLRFIDEKLAEDGYTVLNIQYPTVNENIAEMTEKYIVPNIEEQVKRLEQVNLERKAKNLPELKINFVVHSMGTCLLRYYLKENKLASLGKVVLITPPSHGSQLSDNPIADLIPYFIGPAVKDMKTNKDSFVNQLGNPDYPCYILIADSSNNFLFSLFIKGKDDGMVPLATAGLEGASLKTIENTTHTSILEKQETVDEILQFLKN